MSGRIIITGARAPVALDLGRSFVAAGYQTIFADSVRPYAANWSGVSNEPAIRLPKARQTFPAYKNAISTLLERRVENVNHPAHGEEGLSLSKARLEPHALAQSFETRLRQAQPLLRTSGSYEWHDALTAADAPFIIPTCEEVFYVSAAAQSVDKAHQVYAPPLDTLRTLHSKLLFPAFAGALGIRVPETHALANEHDVRGALAAARTLVFKPEYSRFGTQTLIKPHPDTARALHPTPEAQWIAQDFIAGDEVCLWAAARAGDLVASAVYRPAWRHGQTASYAFEAIDCPAAIDVARTLAKACKLTGQLSLDIILTPTGEAIPIECNPRSTSGVHLFDGDAALARAIMGQGPPVHITQGLRYLWPAMIVLGLPHAVMRGRVMTFWADLRRGKDVLTRPGQRLPAVGALFDAVRFAAMGLTRSKGASRQTTDDIEWNGEPL